MSWLFSSSKGGAPPPPPARAPPVPGKSEGIMKNIGITMPTLPSALRREEEEAPACCGSLTMPQRVMGFGVCLVIGYLISFMSMMTLTTGGKIATFAGLYAFGQIVALAGSGFVVGPARQLRTMFDPIRRWASIIYLVSLALVIVIAIWKPDMGGVVLVLVIIQLTAAIWYSASYVPYGRKVLTAIGKKICGAS